MFVWFMAFLTMPPPNIPTLLALGHKTARLNFAKEHEMKPD